MLSTKSTKHKIMITLRDIGTNEDCIKNIKMTFVESWNLKILVVEKILLKIGVIKERNHLKRLKNIHEEGDDKEPISITGEIKEGFLKSSYEFSESISRKLFDETLNSTYPLVGTDYKRFYEIKKKYKKYLSK